MSVYGYSVNTKKIPMVAAHSGEYAGEVLFYHNDIHVLTFRNYVFINKI